MKMMTSGNNFYASKICYLHLLHLQLLGCQVVKKQKKLADPTARFIQLFNSSIRPIWITSGKQL